MTHYENMLKRKVLLEDMLSTTMSQIEALIALSEARKLSAQEELNLQILVLQCRVLTQVVLNLVEEAKAFAAKLHKHADPFKDIEVPNYLPEEL